MTETEDRTRDRNRKRNSPDQKPFHSPVGRRITVELLEPLAAIFSNAGDRPKCLLGLELDPWDTAWAALSPVLDSIFSGWNYDERSKLAKLKLRMGERLRWRLKQDYDLRWGQEERLHAGHWLLAQADKLGAFDFDKDGLPHLTDKWAARAGELREWMLLIDPVWAPNLEPPTPWTEWSKDCDGFEATFVRDWRPETKASIDVAFLNPVWEHPKGVNSLAQVPLRIDQEMVGWVDRFAAYLLGNTERRRKADEIRIAADIADARWIGDRTFWNDYSCDRRGRIYSLQHLGFGREDHVRSMFRFANGMPLGDPYWLQNHVAKCHGETEKEPEAARIRWVEDHKQDIIAIANDPVGAFDLWAKAESPFAYLAACRELAAAYKDPNFVTHLPIGFDGSANGLQHLALLKGDVVAASKVNLMPSEYLSDDDSVWDVYAEMIDKALERINVDDCSHACWWRSRFYNNHFSAKDRRKLLKTPILAYGYCVTLRGATRQISDVYYKELKQKVKPPEGAFRYLAETVLDVCVDELPGPTAVMEYIKKCAERRAKSDRFLEWQSPSGFPVENRYQEAEFKRINCKSGKKRTTHKIAIGVTDKIDAKAISSAPANFVHSLDSAHLIAVVNGAIGSGITDLLCVHDCYYSHAPNGTRLRQIILTELRDMYRNNPLTDLGRRNDPEGAETPPPEEYLPLNLDDLPQSTNAFR